MLIGNNIVTKCSLCYNKQKKKGRKKLKEKLYTIPVNEAFSSDCECPICLMKKKLEDNAIEFTMGSSYMEDDVRAETDKFGFCTYHVNKLYENQNRLGLAMMLKTHMDKTIKDLETISSGTGKLSSPSLFKKKAEISGVKAYINKLDNSCYICDKINNTFDRYIVTIFSLYQSETEFQNKLKQSKGFCTTHYAVLYDEAPKYLKGDKLEEFIKTLNTIYFDNIKRVRDDLDWFIDKFDYRFVNEPWKNSKDAIPRTITKTNSVL
jgi:hypothetical protein